MATDRRQGAATLTVGAGLSAGGGVLRHQAVRDAHGGPAPGFSWRHPVATYPSGKLLRRGARGRGKYVAGALLGIAGTPAVAVGGRDLLASNKRVEKGLKIIGSVGEAAKPLKAGRYGGALGGAALGSGVFAPLRYPAERIPTKTDIDAGVRAARAFRVTGTDRARHTTRTEVRRAVEEDLWRQRDNAATPNPLYERMRRRRGGGISKVDRPKSFLREGAAGATNALGQRAASVRETPPQAKAVPTAIGIGAGALGSLAAHRSLDRFGAFKHGRLHSARAGIAATVGTTAAAASFPLARHTMAHNRKYEVTPAGVRRRKTMPVRPSKGATKIDARDRSFRTRQQLVPSSDFSKAADYPGRTASPLRQRAAIYAAGATPVVGAYAGAHAAAHFAPPGEKKRAAARQFVGGPVAGLAGGVAGAYGTAHLAEHNPKVREFTDRVASSAQKISTKITDHLPKAPKLAGRTARLREMKAKTIRRAAGSRVGRRAAAPLLRRPIAAGVGFYAAKTLVGQTGGNIAIQRNLAAQRRYNAKHPVVKFKRSEPPLQTKRQQAQQLRRKQRAVATGALATTAGLAGTGLLVARHAPGVAARFGGSRLERAAINTSIGGGGIGAINGIQNQRIARRDIKQQRHELATVIKADLQVSIDHRQAKHLTNKYGMVGPLPRTLSRDERKRAYEARYVTGGGPKAAEHQHRARVAGAVQHASNAVAAGSAATLLASRTGRGRAVGRVARGLLSRRYPGAARVGAHQVERHAENVGLSGVLAGVAAGAASQHAKNKSRKATSMQSGVAAGALRRMQAYEPDRRAS